MDYNNFPIRRGISKTALIIISCVLLLVLVVLVTVAFYMDRSNPPDNTETHSSSQATENSQPLPQMIIHTVEEQNDVVLVTTSYGQFSYPFAFSDIITIAEADENDGVGLVFKAHLNGAFEPLYCLWINSDRGVLAGELRIEDQTYRINLEILSPRADLNKNDLPTFYAAQETLNDVLQSMEANGSFNYSEGANP